MCLKRKKREELNMKNILILSALLLLTLSPHRLCAQPYSIGWFTLDGGGAMNVTGGTYTLSGTIGQPDAGRMTGGNETIDGGFWGLIALVPPRLTITHSGNNVIICW